MTLREEQLLRVHSQKGRSASFCAGAAEGAAPADLTPSVAPAGGWATPAHRPDPAAAARRSQSCKVPGARPRVRRRQKDDALDLADASCEPTLRQEESYHPFLHKAPSCGKVFYQTADGTVMQTYTPEGSPAPAVRARRPPLPTNSTPEESPSLARRPTRGRQGTPSGCGRSSPGSRYKKRAPQEPDPDDPDAYRLRNFSLTAKGIVNRGDSFRVRRASVQSGGSVVGCGTPTPADSPAAATTEASCGDPTISYRVGLVGATGVGKTALVDQFMSSECANAYDRPCDGAVDEKKVSIELDGEEYELCFVNIENPKTDLTAQSLNMPDALLLVYSVIDKTSFERADHELSRLQSLDLLRNRCIVLVGNKIDVVRSRAVDEADGMALAVSYNAKFIEISVGMNHNCDELLVGVLHQVRLKRGSYEPEHKDHSWSRNKGIVRASRKVKRTFSKIFGKEDSRLRNVTNFRVHN